MCVCVCESKRDAYVSPCVHVFKSIATQPLQRMTFKLMIEAYYEYNRICIVFKSTFVAHKNGVNYWLLLYAGKNGLWRINEKLHVFRSIKYINKTEVAYHPHHSSTSSSRMSLSLCFAIVCRILSFSLLPSPNPPFGNGDLCTTSNQVLFYFFFFFCFIICCLLAGSFLHFFYKTK